MFSERILIFIGSYGKQFERNKKQAAQIHSDIDVSGCFVDIVEFYDAGYSPFFIGSLFRRLFENSGFDRDIYCLVGP